MQNYVSDIMLACVRNPIKQLVIAGRDHPVFDSAFRLQEAAQAAVRKVIGTYSQDCEAILGRIAYQPAYGSKDSVQALARLSLQSIRDSQQQESK